MTSDLKIIFAGTPEIAKTVLASVLAAGFKVDLVLTQPDRPKGRGQKLAMSPVKELALKHNIEVFQPLSFKQQPEALAKISALQPDIMIVVAYGLILPQSLLDIPKNGCVNIHVSLLPRHRGAAPIQRAILDGDSLTGVTIMQMDKGLDTGDILLQQPVEIANTDTSGSLHDKLAEVGADLIVEYLNVYQTLKPQAQSLDGVTYAHKIEKSEAAINWQEDAFIIERKIRGFNPAPGCFTYLEQAGQNKSLVKVWSSSVVAATTTQVPGTVISADKNKLYIACANGSVLGLNELQDAGKNRQSVVQYTQGHPNLRDAKFTEA